MEEEKIDFKITPLSMGSVKNLPQFLAQLEEAKVTIGIQEEMPTGESLEDKTKRARAAITKAEADIKKREGIENIASTARTEDQKQELKRLMTMNNLANALQAAKKEESELEKRLEEIRRKVALARDWVHQRVDSDLFRSFKQCWDATKENALKQFFEGIKGVVGRMKDTAPVAVLQMHRHALTQLNCGQPATDVAEALRKLNAIEDLLMISEKHAAIMGMGNLKLADQEAINIMQSGVIHAHGEGDLSEAIQEKLDAGAGAVMTWKEFSGPLRVLLEKRLVTNSLRQQVKDGNMAFKATTSAAMTSTAAAVAAPQQGSSAVTTSTTADVAGVVAQALKEHLALNTKLIQRLAAGGGGGAGGGRRRDNDGGGGGRGRGGHGGQGTCFAFARGKCERGNLCRFQHIKVDVSNIPDCRDGLKCNNSNCVFNHPANSRPGTPKPGDKRKTV